MNTINHISDFIRAYDFELVLNDRRLGNQELADLFITGTKIWANFNYFRKAINIGIFTYNLHLWELSRWNYKWILPVAVSGFICLRKTDLYQNAIRWLIGWTSGWNTRKTIRIGLIQARNQSIFEFISAGLIVLGLNWKFSRITWIMCMPMTIWRGLYFGLATYGLNYVLRRDIQQRLVNSIVAIYESIGDNLSIQQNIKQFEELVDLEEYPETEPQNCSICMQDNYLTMAKIKECHHQFCVECLRQWYTNPSHSFNCPLCRSSTILDSQINNIPFIRNYINQILE